MTDNSQSRELQRKRAQAVKTAWILGFVALTIFVAFFVAATVGR